MNPAGNHHPVILQTSLKLVVWATSEKVYSQKKYQKGLQPLLQIPKELAHLNITNLLGPNELPSAVESKYVRSDIIIWTIYLAGLLDSGLQYNTIISHGSAILAFCDSIGGIKVGDHPRIPSLMTPVFNKRPPQPKCIFNWDVETVLTSLRSHTT